MNTLDLVILMLVAGAIAGGLMKRQGVAFGCIAAIALIALALPA